MTRARIAHDPALRGRFPALRVRTLIASRLDHAARQALDAEPHLAAAAARLAGGTEAEQPAIRAWRAAYAALGLKPTQTRCAAEALLRRLRLDGALPRVGPVVDLCNAVSAAFAIPLAGAAGNCAALATWKTGLALGTLRASAPRIQRGQEGPCGSRATAADQVMSASAAAVSDAPSRRVTTIANAICAPPRGEL